MPPLDPDVVCTSNLFYAAIFLFSAPNLNFAPSMPAAVTSKRDDKVNSRGSTNTNSKATSSSNSVNSNHYVTDPLSSDITVILHDDEIKTEEEEDDQLFVAEIVNIDDEEDDKSLKASANADVSVEPQSVFVMTGVANGAVSTPALRHRPPPSTANIPLLPPIRPVPSPMVSFIELGKTNIRLLRYR
jgi:hypothetical protein